MSPADTSSSAGSVVASRLEVEHQIRAELRSTATALVAEVTASIPAYASLTADQNRELIALNTWVVDKVLYAWVHDSFLSEQDQQRIDGIAAARAIAGRPMPTVLRACHVGAHKLIDILVERGGERLSAEDVHALTRLGMQVMDYFDQAVYKNYEATDRRRGNRSQALGDLLHDLLMGRQVSAGALADRCQELDVLLPQTPVVLAVQAATPATTVHGLELREVLADCVPGSTPEANHSSAALTELIPLCGNVNRNAVAVLRALDHGSVSQALASRGWLGCAVERYPLANIAHAHELAAVALRRAPDSAFATRALLRDGDAEVLALLSADATANPLAVRDAVFRDLDPRNGQHLIDALDAYLRTGDAVAAAQLIHMHPQTLRYRLRRMTALTELDPRQPWDRFLLQTAVTISSAAHENRS